MTIRLHGTRRSATPPSSGSATPPSLRIHHTSRPTHRTSGLVGVDLTVTLDPPDQEVNR